MAVECFSKMYQGLVTWCTCLVGVIDHQISRWSTLPYCIESTEGIFGDQRMSGAGDLDCTESNWLQFDYQMALKTDLEWLTTAKRELCPPS